MPTGAEPPLPPPLPPPPPPLDELEVVAEGASVCSGPQIHPPSVPARPTSEASSNGGHSAATTVTQCSTRLSRLLVITNVQSGPRDAV